MEPRNNLSTSGIFEYRKDLFTKSKMCLHNHKIILNMPEALKFDKY